MPYNSDLPMILFQYWTVGIPYGSPPRKSFSYRHKTTGTIACVLLYAIFCASACGIVDPPQVTPTPTASVTSALVQQFVERYVGYVLSGDDDSAYPMLSSDQMHRISRKQFAKNMNYTLMPGCWTKVQEVPPALEKDGVTWEMGLVMEYVPYGSTKMYSFYWHFQVRMERGKLVVAYIGLTGTSVGDAGKLPCTWRVGA